MCHRLKVFADGNLVYSNSIGRKKEFHYSDIAKIEQKQISGTLSLTFRDAAGKYLGKVEGNMKGYEELCQWLNTKRKKAEEAETMGIQNNHELEVTPVNGGTAGKGVRIFLIIMGLVMIALGIVCAFGLFETDTSLT